MSRFEGFTSSNQDSNFHPENECITGPSRHLNSPSIRTTPKSEDNSLDPISHGNPRFARQACLFQPLQITRPRYSSCSRNNHDRSLRPSSLHQKSATNKNQYDCSGHGTPPPLSEPFLSRYTHLISYQGAKSLIILAYILLSEYVPRFQRWHSYKAIAILSCLEVLFWSGVAGLTFQANMKYCQGVTCALSWVVFVIAVIVV